MGGGVNKCLEAGLSPTCQLVGKQTNGKRAGKETGGEGRTTDVNWVNLTGRLCQQCDQVKGHQ